MLALPEVKIGTPLCHEALTVFPLFTEANSSLDYLLADEAIASGSVVVEEIGEAGSVPDLRVSNQSDSRVLFIEGEELRGAKQNRVLNTSVLVAAHSQTTIPVSCVEQGRWHYRTRQFGSGGSHSSSKLRRILKQTVSDSTLRGEGHRSDQSQVWAEVSRQMDSLGTSSGTFAMADTYDSYGDRLAEYRKRLDYVEGATGLAVAVGDQVVAIDLFDQPSTCRKAWSRLLSGLVMDALEAGKTSAKAAPGDVEALLARLRAARWKPAPAVGEGQEYRSDGGGALHASALMFGGAVVHGSAVVAA